VGGGGGSKSVRKRSAAPYAAGGAANRPQQGTIDHGGKKAEPGSKQSRVIANAAITRGGDDCRHGGRTRTRTWDPLPDENPDDAESEIMAILQTLKCKKEGFDASLKRIVWWSGYSVAPEEPIVRIACGAFEKVIGRKPRIAGKDASTDASWIHTLSGIPVVMFRPGNGLEAMNANENVGIDDLVTATKIMGQIIIDVLADAGDRAAGVDN
jgi:hypothetical protein